MNFFEKCLKKIRIALPDTISECTEVLCGHVRCLCGPGRCLVGPIWNLLIRSIYILGGVHFLPHIPGRMNSYRGTKHIPGSRARVRNILQIE